MVGSFLTSTEVLNTWNAYGVAVTRTRARVSVVATISQL
jgi:hypothetical protein